MMKMMVLLAALTWFCAGGHAGSEAPVPFYQDEDPGHPDHVRLAVQGWTVHLNRALWERDPGAVTKMLRLLDGQLKRVTTQVPAPALVRLRAVPIWINPPYPDTRPTAEYHPNPAWLKAHGRDPALAKAIELTNTAIFPAENRRMPSLLLHELAHAYHDQVLGFDDPDLRAAYEQARQSGRYDHVKRFTGKTLVTDRAYALTNPKEYFAELSEAFFGRNDFAPFDREELRRMDPEGFAVVARKWGVNGEPVAE
jgi:dipeptidyl-peptidase-4